MKINLIIPSFYPATVYGGPIFSTLHACESLSELEGVEVFVSTTNANRDSKLDVEVNKWIKSKDSFFIKYYDETRIDKFSITLFFNIWKDIAQSNIVHLQGIFSSPTPISLIYSVILKKPVLLSPRGSFNQWAFTHGSQFKKLWMWLAINPFAKHLNWHATSDLEKNDILRLFPNSKVHIVPNGIDLTAFSNTNYLENRSYVKKFIDKDAAPSKIIVSMGRLHKVKGFDILINSFKKVLQQYPEALLLIAGKDVGEKINLDNLINKLELNCHVYFVGEVSGQDKVDFLANANLFVLPSYTENFGNVFIESLASGTPIVASKGTPWQEIEPAECGLWVENEIGTTADAILEMLEKDAKIISENARLFAQKFDWKNIALQFKGVFEQILEK